MSVFAYLYCLTEGEPDLTGITSMEPEHPLQLAAAGRPNAVWSEVGEDFAEANLNARIRDLDWLSPRAVRHHEVVDALYARSKPLLPLSFGAIFASLASLTGRLEAERENLLERLDHLRGRDEWNMKLTRDDALLAEHVRRDNPDLAAKPPGTRFLLEKKLKNLEEQERKRIAAAVRTEVHDALTAIAAEAHRDQLTPGSPLELRSAYLVLEEDVDRLQQAVAELTDKYAPAGYSLELTGPWPPFTFARAALE